MISLEVDICVVGQNVCFSCGIQMFFTVSIRAVNEAVSAVVKSIPHLTPYVCEPSFPFILLSTSKSLLLFSTTVSLCGCLLFHDTFYSIFLVVNILFNLYYMKIQIIKLIFL